MKKFKNYILMLLVPLILLGCVSKGVSDAISEVTDTYGGYTLSELQYMSTGSGNIYSISKNVTYEISALQNIYSSGTKNTALTSHKALLTTAMNEIDNGTINVTNTLTNLKTSNTNLITTLDFYTQMEIATIAQLIDEATVNTTAYNSLTSSEQTELKHLPILLNDVINILTEVSDYNSTKTGYYNIFYSNLYQLYLAYEGINNNKAALKNVYNIDVTTIDESDIIQEKITRLNFEVTRLKSEIIKKILTSSDITYLSDAYTNLLTTYNAYSPLKSYLIDSSEATFRQRDIMMLGTGGTNNVGISKYETILDSVYLSVGDTFSNTTSRDGAIKNYLYEFASIKSAYSLSNYRVSISKAVNIAYIYANLKTTYKQDIYNTTRITLID